MEHRHAKHQRAHGEKIRKRQLLPDQILIFLQLGFQDLAVGVKGAEAVVAVFAEGYRPVEDGQDDPADGGEEVRVGEGEPFEDAVVVAAGCAEEGGGVRLGGDCFVLDIGFRLNWFVGWMDKEGQGMIERIFFNE